MKVTPRHGQLAAISVVLELTSRGGFGMAREYSIEELSASDDPFLKGMLAERRRIQSLHLAHRRQLETAGLWPRLPNLVESGADVCDQGDGVADRRPFLD